MWLTSHRLSFNPSTPLQCAKKLKNKKAPGPDGLKNEPYKKLSSDHVTLESLTECYINIIEGENCPINWKESVTVMIPKKRKPMVSELRPLSLTDTSYKIFMSIIKESIENHIKINGMTKENQAGFTKGGKVQDNLFILKEIVENGCINKECTIITAINFRKA